MKIAVWALLIQNRRMKTVVFSLTLQPIPAIMVIEKALLKSGSAQLKLQFISQPKPSLGRVAVSACYTDRDSPVEDMKGQCNRHHNTPFRRCDGTAFCRLATPYPCGQQYSTEDDKICQLLHEKERPGAKISSRSCYFRYPSSTVSPYIFTVSGSPWTRLQRAPSLSAST